MTFKLIGMGMKSRQGSARSIFWSFLATILVVTLLTGCGNSEAENQPEPMPMGNGITRVIPVETETVQLETFDDVIQITGTVASLNDVVVSAQTAGTLEYVAPVGTSVSRGGLIARTDATLLEAARDQARAALAAVDAQLNLAQDAVDRQEPLYRDSIISALEFEGVRTQLASAKAQRDQSQAVLNQAEKQLRNTRVVAPFAGTIEQRLAEPGSQAIPGTPVAQIVSTARVKIVAGVSERYAADIRRGIPAIISLAAYGADAIEGQISFVGNVVNANSRTFPVEIELNNPNGLLKPQMTAEISVVRERLENVLTVPQNAIVRDENGNSVFSTKVVEGKKVATRIPIEVGPSHDGRTVVMSGLQPGDEVIVAGQSTLTENDVIEVLQ